ncbi:hypothetical protein HYH39_02345 [Clostridium botulinum]|uniref:hypothetical protein n=1 Tax=Clostridium sp. M14 TaxID=2716311 RepID=UPI000503BD6E|nr:hypothetical protein [Clostridium sp. M14]KFX57595.1 hypothetical protein KU40_06900 [Clostridium botulinum]MBY6778044.1 hypothetical protein [Clostridium botulinum]MBY6850968.1 hypothetical protein [Clostridium botulinum]MBZ9691634.1 hypothetical protein [Clostridium sp. M14]NFF25035.1 hypothetical protein [Clostridium botulinum]
MDYTIYSDEQLINWNAKGNEKILQNVNNILNLIKNEVPYARNMGRDLDNIDLTIARSRYKLIEETYDLIQKYEPRVTVKKVTVSDEVNPFIKVVVTID